MRFEYTVTRSYEDVGGGQVLHSAPGFPGFPARLAVELFERARRITGHERVGLWDPMCGAGGMVATIALLRPAALTRVLATDADDAALELAAKNIRLTTADGLLARRQQLVELSATPERIASVERLLAGVERRPPLRADTGQADVTDPGCIARMDLTGIDLVIADLPYGKQTRWESRSKTPVASALDALRGALPVGSVIVFVSEDRESFRDSPTAFRSFKHGHRHIRVFRVD